MGSEKGLALAKLMNSMIRIGVVSDTHSQQLPRQLIEDFKKVDFIVHTGDFCTLDDLAALTDIKDVKGVYGNMDDTNIRKHFGRKQIIGCGSLAIGLFHGEGPPNSVLEVVQKEFQGDRVDAVIFGHSHHPLNKEINNVLYFNPGSPNDRIFAPYRSYGIIEIIDKKIKGKIVKVKD